MLGVPISIREIHEALADDDVKVVAEDAAALSEEVVRCEGNIERVGIFAPFVVGIGLIDRYRMG